MTLREKKDRLAKLTALVASKGNAPRAASAQRDKGSKKRFLAVRVPALRSIALKDFAMKELAAADRLKLWDYVWRQSQYYEVMSVPLCYYYAKGTRIEPETFDVVCHWIDRVDDWGHCDGLSGIYSFLNHNDKRKVMPFLRQLNESDNRWRVRASVVSLIHYSGRNAAYLSPDEVFPLLEPHLANSDKYIANAVGWVLREMRRDYADEIDAYVLKNAGRLSRIALSKARLTHLGRS
ncbi:MAG: DNA alkylation repair protein [Candidatus Binataceae bacterium]